jgi:hypothetical protein
MVIGVDIWEAFWGVDGQFIHKKDARLTTIKETNDNLFILNRTLTIVLVIKR